MAVSKAMNVKCVDYQVGEYFMQFEVPSLTCKGRVKLRDLVKYSYAGMLEAIEFINGEAANV